MTALQSGHQPQSLQDLEAPLGLPPRLLWPVCTWSSCIWLLVSLLTGSGLPKAQADQTQLLQPLVTTEDVFEHLQLLAVQPETTPQSARLRFAVSVPEGDSLQQTLEVLATEVVRYGHPQLPGRKGQLVLLADGGQVLGQVERLAAGALRVNTGSLGTIRLRERLVQAIVYQRPSDPKQLQQLLTRLKQASPSDPGQHEVWLINGDRLTGRVTDLQVGEDAATPKITLKASSGRLKLPPEGIRAIRFNREPVRATADGFRWWVGLRDGTLIQARSLAVSEKQVTLEPSSASARPGEPWVVQPPFSFSGDASARDQLVYLQANGGRSRYLSDELREQGNRAVVTRPFLELAPEFQLDRNVLGLPFSVNGQSYRKGLGTQSFTVVKYRLSEGDTKFASEVAIDDHAGQMGSVDFVVQVLRPQGDPRGNTRFVSPIIRGGSAPFHLNVDVTGGRLLVLGVRFADRGDVCDYANWLDARIVTQRR